jgi:spore coat protein CotH
MRNRASQSEYYLTKYAFQAEAVRAVMKAFSLVVAIGLIWAALVVGKPALAGTTNSETAYLSDLFAGRTVLHFQIQIPRDGIRKLSGDGWNELRTSFGLRVGRQRPFALATVSERGQVYTNVEIHLKGGAGSYRPVDDNPGLTLNFEKYAPGQSFHGLKKFSLNNSVQDPTFLNEKISRELFNAAGSPTPRAGFATVQLNGRKLGVHVLTEGFNKQFLRQHFENVHGNLYQTHGNQEITDRLDVNSGDDPKNDAGLRALAEAIQDDPAVRWQRMVQALDVDKFSTFMAMEVMLCHWDGYCMNQNNYRVFHDLGDNKIVFIAHGMDQMLGTGTFHGGGPKGTTDCPIFPRLAGAVAEAFMSVPEGRHLYLARLGQLYTNLFRVEALLKRVDDLSNVVGNALTDSDSPSARNYQRKVNELKAHIEERDKSLARQLNDALTPRDPRAYAPVHLTGWTMRAQEGKPEFEQTTDGSRQNVLHISVPHGKAAGSWRTRALLEPGRYRFEGDIRVRVVDSGDDAAGARLRISGARPVRRLSASTDWRQFAFEFQVDGNRQIEFVCELRAAEGEAWFDAESLQVVRVE